MKLVPLVMTRTTAPAVSTLHYRSRALTAAALCYEYFENPDIEGRLYYAVDDQGHVVASQAFVGFTLIKAGIGTPTLMSERTLLDPKLRGKANFSEFYAEALQNIVAIDGAEFIWGGTAAVNAFRKFGFKAVACFFDDAIVSGITPIAFIARLNVGWRFRLYHTALLALALGRGLITRGRCPSAGLQINEIAPDEKDITELVHAVSTAHPESYFLRYTQAKLNWMVYDNVHRKRLLLFLRRKNALVGFAIIEDRGDGFAYIVDLLLLDTQNATAYFNDLATYLSERGFDGLRYWGNGQNEYVATLRGAFKRLGSVSFTANVSLVIRGPFDQPDRHPPAAALGMTGAWGPPA